MILSALVFALIMGLVGLMFTLIIHFLSASIPPIIAFFIGGVLSLAFFWFLGWWFFGRKK